MVRGAQDGDVQAVRTLVADNLPLVYTLVVRAAGPTVDVEDVLTRTVLLVAAGMPGMAEADNFRPWLLGTALRFLWTAEEAAGNVRGRDNWPVLVPVDQSDQREEATAAVRWLVADDREVLSMWWLEASGELGREEVIAACGLSPAQAGNRIRQIEARFEDARTAIRTLGATPPCMPLAALLQHWDRRPSDRQRRQIARHATDCPNCSARAGDLIPADRLLRGTPLLTPPPALVEALLTRCERTTAPAASSGAGTVVDRVRRTVTLPWVATSARIIAGAVAVALLIMTLLAYADSRKDRSEPAGLRRTGAATQPVVQAPQSAPPTGNRTLELSGARSLRSVANSDRYVQVVNDLAFVVPVSRSSSAVIRRAATFAVVTGLADPACRSFRDASGRYLRHFRFRLRLDPDDKSALFRKDATFCPRAGTTAQSVSLQSINYPDRYLHLRGDELWIDKSDGTAGFLTTSSFDVVGAWV